MLQRGNTALAVDNSLQKRTYRGQPAIVLQETEVWQRRQAKAARAKRRAEASVVCGKGAAVSIGAVLAACLSAECIPVLLLFVLLAIGGVAYDRVCGNVR